MFGATYRSSHNEAGIYANLLSSDCPYHSPHPSRVSTRRAKRSLYISHVHTWPGCRRTCRRSYAYTVTPIAPKAGTVDLEMPRIAASIWNSARNTGNRFPDFARFHRSTWVNEWVKMNVYVCVFVCVCMCEREKEAERGREEERQYNACETWRSRFSRFNKCSKKAKSADILQFDVLRRLSQKV